MASSRREITSRVKLYFNSPHSKSNFVILLRPSQHLMGKKPGARRLSTKLAPPLLASSQGRPIWFPAPPSSISVYEDIIYRSAYSLHGFLPCSKADSATVDDIHAEHPQLLQGDIGGWKTVCKKRFLLESFWAGDGPSSFKRHSATVERTCRLKADEKHGLIINSVCEGGLVVTDILEPDRVL